MFRTPSLLGPLNSGFVDFAPAATGDSLAQAEAAEVLARAAAAPADDTLERAPAAAWTPASSARIRTVEALVLAAVCAYFGFGLVRTFAGL